MPILPRQQVWASTIPTRVLLGLIPVPFPGPLRPRFVEGVFDKGHLKGKPRLFISENQIIGVVKYLTCFGGLHIEIDRNIDMPGNRYERGLDTQRL